MPQKRKQTPDMPQSPPKRVTRARAKKDVDSKPGTTRIMTPSTKASTRKKVAAEPPKLAGVKPQLIEEVDVEPEPDLVMEQPAAEPAKTRGKAKATSSATAKPTAKTPTTPAPAKSTRSRSAKLAATASDDARLPKAKGRPKQTAGQDAPAAPETVDENNEVQPPPKPTRSRAAAVPAKPPSTRTRAATAVPKKRVKFDDEAEQDKENQPIPVNAQKKSEPKATGLRAKPIRKPAIAKGPARVTKTTKQSTKTEDNAPKQDVLPLSPKKITQVAKTPSVASEDELVGNKSPLKILSKSPSKIPMSVGWETNATFSEMNTENVDVPEPPKEEASPERLATSPRKPPPSPFKNALKGSPRKVDLGSRPAQPKFDAPSSPSKSPLKASPKRVNLGDSTVQPILQWSKTPMKSSLLQSPARRPGGSSMKSTFTFTPSKTIASVPTVEAATTSKQVNTFELPKMSVGSAASTPLRAARSPGKALKVHESIEERRSEDPATTPAVSTFKAPETQSLDSSPEVAAGKASLEPKHLPEQPDEVTASEVATAEAEFDDSMSLDLEDCPTHALRDIPLTHDEELSSDLQQPDAAASNIEADPTIMEYPWSLAKPVSVLRSSMLADRVEESESEDELASPQKPASPSPLKIFGVSTKDFGTPSITGIPKGNYTSTMARRTSTRRSQRDSVAMTPLAMQMSSWLASSPEKKTARQVGHKRGIFSPAKPIVPVLNGQSPVTLAIGSPAKSTFFDDEMVVRDADDVATAVEEGSTDELQDNYDGVQVDLQASQESQASEIYGDENAVPEDPVNYVLEQEEQNHTLTCTPAKVFDQYSREIHTVSKVPLRPAADDSPLIVTRKRSRSLAGPLSDISMPDRMSISRDSILSPMLQDRNLSMSMLPGDPTAPDTPETPTAGMKSTPNTPGRSFRKAGYSSVLKGAVVHVDVHTSEGADASGIFVDLLTQMGARCVKQWHWNPHGSLSSSSGTSPNHAASPEPGTPGGKIGITHVVYKDGGKRTLEKVRDAKGVVVCVGVGWVLEYVLISSIDRND